MIKVNDMAAQGDVLFRRVDRVPPDVEEQQGDGRIVVAHSETGHDHAIHDPAVRLYEKRTRDPLVCFLSVDSEFADVVHHRSHDTHDTLRLTRGVWEVRRQREWEQEGARLVRD